MNSSRGVERVEMIVDLNVDKWLNVVSWQCIHTTLSIIQCLDIHSDGQTRTETAKLLIHINVLMNKKQFKLFRASYGKESQLNATLINVTFERGIPIYWLPLFNCLGYWCKVSQLEQQIIGHWHGFPLFSSKKIG